MRRLKNRPGRIRCKVHDYEGGAKVTLSGVGCSDLRSILCEAMLYNYARMKEEQTDEARLYSEHMLGVLRYVEAAVMEGIAGTHPPRHIRPPTKAERLAVVKEEIRFRKALDACIEAARA